MMEDIVKYFTRITGFNPTPEQVDMLKFLTDDTKKNCIVSCGRGFSKTLLCAIVVLWYAEKSLEGDPLQLMLVSPQQAMYDYCNQYFISEKLRERRIKKGVYTEIPVDGFQLDNGTNVFTKPATSKVRSARADILFIDECADVPEEVIKSSMGCLKGDINRIVLVSTCHKSGYFTQRVSNPKKYGYEMMQFSSELCPWMKQSVERAKRELNKAEYAMDVLGRAPTKAERSFFPSKNIDKCLVDGDVLKQGGKNSEIEIGIDWGYENTVVTVTERINAKRRVLFVKGWKNKAIDDTAPLIAKIISKWKPVIIKADSRPQEYQGILEKYTKDKITYVPTEHCKHELLTQVKTKFLHKQLEISRSQVELIKQLKRYRQGMSRGDDYVDSLCFSVYESPLLTKNKCTGKVFFG